MRMVCSLSAAFCTDLTFFKVCPHDYFLGLYDMLKSRRITIAGSFTKT